MQPSSMLKNEQKQPLVSIIVITYNSSKYVIETLESAKAQTYENMELIVTDDCSTDDTAQLCAKWIEKNKDRFVRTRLITSLQNTGISPNCNRGLKDAKGEWIKFIAGDDLLKDSCISDCIEYINNSCQEIEILFGKIKEFRNNIDLKDPDDEFIDDQDSFFHKSPKEQYLLMLKSNIVPPAPASFLKRSFLIAMGGFDERYPMLEDYPLWLKATESGIKIYGFPNITAFYRCHHESVYNSGYLLPYIVNPFCKYLELFEIDYVYSRLNSIEKLGRKYRYARHRIIVFLGNNANNYFLRALNKTLKVLDPTLLYFKFLKK